MTEQQPKTGQRAARVALAVLAGALGTALVGGGLWMAFRPERRATPSEIDRAEQAERTESPTLPVVPTTPSTTTPPPSGTSTSAPSAVETPTTEVRTKRAPRVAFRLEGALYVSDEAGRGRVKVATAAEGPFALSPDGTTLVWIAGGSLKASQVGGGKPVTIGPADATFVPVWAGDSSLFVYSTRVGDASMLMRGRKGAASSTSLAAGLDAAVSPDGAIIVIRDANDTTADGSGSVLVSVNGGAFAQLAVPGGEATGVGASSSRVFVGLAASDQGSAIVSLKPDGSDRKDVAGGVPGTMPAVWGGIVPSPSGAMLVVEAQGDDGYSRAYTVPAGGGQLTALGTRLDLAVRGWSADGSRLFLIEGNAIQGESTSLVSVKPDGSSHRVIVAGAE